MYTETGILIKRLLYEDITMRCGKPVSISEDGRYMIFRQSNTTPELYLIQVTFNGLVEIRTLHIQQEVEKCIQTYEMDPYERVHMMNFYEHFMDKMSNLRNINLTFCLNDNGDILVRIKPKDRYLKKRKEELYELIDAFSLDVNIDQKTRDTID